MLKIIPDYKIIDEYVKFAEEESISFEYNDFFVTDFVDDKKKLKDRIDLYLSLGRDTRNDTLHGAFFDVIHFSSDKKIREISLDRMRQSLDIAQRLSCKGVVFHTNLNPLFLRKKEYENMWLEYSISAVQTLLDESSGVEIYFENMFDDSQVQLKKLADSINSPNRFGVCLDIAHMILATDDIEIWFEQLSPYIKHFHLNDTCLEYDDHLPIGDGKIDWKKIFSLMDKYNMSNVSRLFEVNGIDAAKKSYEFYKKLSNSSSKAKLF